MFREGVLLPVPPLPFTAIIHPGRFPHNMSDPGVLLASHPVVMATPSEEVP